MVDFLSFYLASIQWAKKAVLVKSDLVFVFKSYSLEDLEKKRSPSLRLL